MNEILVYQLLFIGFLSGWTVAFALLGFSSIHSDSKGDKS